MIHFLFGAISIYFSRVFAVSFKECNFPGVIVSDFGFDSDYLIFERRKKRNR